MHFKQEIPSFKSRAFQKYFFSHFRKLENICESFQILSRILHDIPVQVDPAHRTGRFHAYDVDPPVFSSPARVGNAGYLFSRGFSSKHIRPYMFLKAHDKSMISAGLKFPKNGLFGKYFCLGLLGFHKPIDIKISIQQRFKASKMMQDAKNPMCFGKKLTRECADPSMSFYHESSLYTVM